MFLTVVLDQGGIIVVSQKDNNGSRIRLLIISLLLLISAMVPCASFADGEYKEFELFRELIHVPTAGILKEGQSDLDMRIYSNSGIHLSAGLGLRNNITIGFTLGGENIIGDGVIDWNPQIQFDLKYRIVGEDKSIPAIVLGFDSQGFGTYHEDKVNRISEDEFGEEVVIEKEIRVDRYDYKSKGIYIVGTKNFPISDMGNLGIHFGFNYSFETKDDDTDLNFFMGLDKNLNDRVNFIFEYDGALNDNDHRYKPLNGDRHKFGAKESMGFLNLGLRWEISNRFSLEGALIDVLESAGVYGRELRMTYLTNFFGGEKHKKPKDKTESLKAYPPPDQRIDVESKICKPIAAPKPEESKESPPYNNGDKSPRQKNNHEEPTEVLPSSQKNPKIIEESGTSSDHDNSSTRNGTKEAKVINELVPSNN